MYVRVGASELARFENHTARIMIVTLIIEMIMIY